MTMAQEELGKPACPPGHLALECYSSASGDMTVAEMACQPTAFSISHPGWLSPCTVLPGKTPQLLSGNVFLQ